MLDSAQHLDFQRQHLLVSRLRAAAAAQCGSVRRWQRQVGRGARTSSFFLLMTFMAHMCPVAFSFASLTSA